MNYCIIIVLLNIPASWRDKGFCGLVTITYDLYGMLPSFILCKFIYSHVNHTTAFIYMQMLWLL